MAVTEKTSGAQTTTNGTEHVLATVTDPGIYVLRLDLAGLSAGDVMEMRVYAKCRVGTDSERLLQGPAIVGPILPDQKLTDTVPNVSSGYWKATIKQTTGTGRSVPWVVLSTGA